MNNGRSRCSPTCQVWTVSLPRLGTVQQIKSRLKRHRQKQRKHFRRIMPSARQSDVSNLDGEFPPPSPGIVNQINRDGGKRHPNRLIANGEKIQFNSANRQSNQTIDRQEKGNLPLEFEVSAHGPA
jgi:hypothetical protein